MTSRFARSVVVLSLGSVSSQAVAVVVAPMITRLYGPAAYGLLGVFMAVLAMATPVAALSYPVAIVLPRDDAEARGLARLSALLAVALALGVALVLVVAGDWPVRLLRSEQIASYVFLIPLTMFFAAMQQIGQQWLVRTRSFRWLAFSAVVLAILLNAGKVAMGFLWPSGGVLIVLTSVATAVHAVMLWPAVRQTWRRERLPEIELKLPDLRSLARRYADFPRFRAPQVLINAFSQSLPVVMLAALFGASAAGHYALCTRILGMATVLIGQSVADVFYPRLAEACHRGENLTNLIVKATAGLALVGSLPFALVTAFGPSLFGWVFGAEWRVAGEYARWLAVWLFFQFVNRPCVTAVPVLGIQKGLVIYEVFSTGSKVLAVCIGFLWFKNDVVTIALFSLLGTAAYVALIAWVLLVARKRDRSRKMAETGAGARQ